MSLVHRVRERILSGAVPPGGPVRQDALAAELGVSKIPLREAMVRLEQEGLLRSQTNRGYFIPPLDPGEAREVYALRLKLEPDSASLAARRATEPDRRGARAALEALEAAMKARNGVGELNRAFHLALVRPAGEPLTFAILERLHILSERYVRKHLEPFGRGARANAEHRELLEAWVEGEADRVADLTRAHLLETLDDLLGQLPQAHASKGNPA